jgi:hypothetical protein
MKYLHIEPRVALRYTLGFMLLACSAGSDSLDAPQKEWCRFEPGQISNLVHALALN